MPPPDAVAILRFSSLGDIVLTSPAVEALHTAWPQTKILFVTKERFRPLVAHNPNITEVIGLADGESAFSLARRLRERGAKAVLDLHGKIRSKAMHAALSDLPWVTWRKRETSQSLSTSLGFGSFRAAMPTADRYHFAVEQLVGSALPKGYLHHFIGPDDAAASDRVLREAGGDPNRSTLALSPGAAWEAKRWPVERFGALAARAIAAGLQVVVQGSADERPLAAAVISAAPGAIDLSGRLDLAALGGLLSRCAAFVTNDSGPMHIARGLGVPTLAIFGTTDPAMFRFEGHSVLSAGLECSPCSFFGRNGCPLGHFKCMRDLDVDRAWAALQPLLDGRRRDLLSA